MKPWQLVLLQTGGGLVLDELWDRYRGVRSHTHPEVGAPPVEPNRPDATSAIPAMGNSPMGESDWVEMMEFIEMERAAQELGGCECD